MPIWLPLNGPGKLNAASPLRSRPLPSSVRTGRTAPAKITTPSAADATLCIIATRASTDSRSQQPFRSYTHRNLCYGCDQFFGNEKF